MSSFLQTRWYRWGAAIAVGVIGAVSVLGLDTADKLGSVGSFLVGIAALLLTLAVTSRTTEVSATEHAVADLAVSMDRQWDAEARLRDLKPQPIRIGWHYTRRPVAAPYGLPDERPEHAGGDVTTLTESWLRLPARQLVILGTEGSGKTSAAVLHVVRLLALRREGIPVPIPVLLNLSSWDPNRQSLDDWLTRQLATELQRCGVGTAVFHTLLEQGEVVPILDGLDEIPEALRPVAVARLTQAVRDSRPIVVTCRAEEYSRIIAATGKPLARARVVEIEPMTSAQAAAYLSAQRWEGDRSWQPVGEYLLAHPRGPLAESLATPLMVYLARAAYPRQADTPEELLRLGSAAQIEEHLLRRYLPAVYAQWAARPPEPSLRDYPAEKAERWLSFLARRLDDRGGSGLMWWRLPAALPPGEFGVLVGLSTAVVSAVAIVSATRSVLIGLVYATGVSVAAGVAGNLATRTLGAEPPKTLAITWGTRREPAETARPLRFGLALGFATAVVGAVSLGPRFYGPDTRIDVGTIVLVVVAAFLSFGLVFGSATPIVADHAVSPMSTLRADRAATWSTAAAGGIIVGFVFWRVVEARTGAIIGGAVCVARAIGGAYGGYLHALAGLAMGRWLPSQLMPFLEDAHRRGVLRQVGPAYQFRHDRLKRYLITTSGS